MTTNIDPPLGSTSPSPPRRTTSNTAAQVEFLELLTSGDVPRDFDFRFWDGSYLGADPGCAPRFTLVFNHPGALRRAFWPKNKLGFGEAYIFGEVDVEGDSVALLFMLRRVVSQQRSVDQHIQLFKLLHSFPDEAGPRVPVKAPVLAGEQRSRERDKQAIEYSYEGPPGEFFALFLDRSLQYSCGYFARPDQDIHEAQERKLDYICRKLRLQPGERLIDIGCGWGGLIVFAAKHYGVDATGVSLSNQQIQRANQEIQRQGLADRCRAVYCHYRDIPETERFDKAVSVGFIEHVGEAMLPVYFSKVWRLLKEQGLYLNHGITMKPFTKEELWKPFALKYVFPDGELVPITNTLHELAKVGFEIRDVESLREHYSFTLERWLERLEASRETAINLTDEVTYRIYRIYFAGSILGFRLGLFNLYQSLVIKCGETLSELPLTREDLYARRA